MIQSMRWFGPDDPVRLDGIGQSGATEVVIALHDVANGDVWSREAIEARRHLIEAAGLGWSVVDSLPVREAIKTGLPDRDRLIDRYRETLTNLAACGVGVVTYDFMPLFDWTWTDLAWPMPDGALALRFELEMVATFDMHMLERPTPGRCSTESQTYRTGFASSFSAWTAFFAEHGATSADHGHSTAGTTDLSPGDAEALFLRLRDGGASPADAQLFRAQMLTEVAGTSVEDGLLSRSTRQLPQSRRAPFRRFERDRGADIPTRTDHLRGLKPLLDRYGDAPGLILILFTLDETTYSRERAPLTGHYSCLRLGPPWWFHDSPEGMRRFRETTTETAGFYRTVGFNDTTRAFPADRLRLPRAARRDGQAPHAQGDPFGAGLSGLGGRHRFVHEVDRDPAIGPVVDRLMRVEAAGGLDADPALDTRAYADALLARFSNAAPPHRLSQIAADGSRKITQRRFASLAANRAMRRACPATLKALASWLRHARGHDGQVDDPMPEDLRRLRAAADAARVARALFHAQGAFSACWVADEDELAAPVDLQAKLAHRR